MLSDPEADPITLCPGEKPETVGPVKMIVSDAPLLVVMEKFPTSRCPFSMTSVASFVIVTFPVSCRSPQIGDAMSDELLEPLHLLVAGRLGPSCGKDAAVLPHGLAGMLLASAAYG